MTALILFPLLARGATPRTTVDAFVRAMNAGDLAGMARQVVGTPRRDLGRTAGKARSSATVGQAIITGDEANVEVDLRIEATGEGALVSHDTVHLRRMGSDWRIVPAPLSNLQTPTLSMIASTVVEANPGVTPTSAAVPATPAPATKASSEMSGVVQIALATLMYAEDHGHRLPTAEGFRSAVAPYLEGEALLTASDGSIFFLDPRLSGMLTTDISHPADVALIVLGKGGRVTFPFGGKTRVGFADGHAAEADRIEAYRARTIALGRP